MSIGWMIQKNLRKLEKPYDVYNEITISRSALLSNFDLFQTLIPNGYIIPVLKSNAYGHGDREVATILKQRRFPYIAVDGYFEALRIRDVSKQPVLVMGAIKLNNFKRISSKRIAFVVHEKSVVEALGQSRKQVNIHVELETGMGRHGVMSEELSEFIQTVQRYPNIHIEGVMTHLADADNPDNDTYTKLQTSRFDQYVEYIKKAGFKPEYIHIAQSAGSIKAISRYANTLRIGLALYGVNPLNSNDKQYYKLTKLQPVLTLTSTIAKILPVKPGDRISYNGTYIAKKRTHIGVLPLGYYEGLPRSLSNKGIVEYKGRYFPIVGRICMNHTMINLGDSDISLGDKVDIISPKKNSFVSVEHLCSSYSLFSYSLFVGLNQNIRRQIVD